MVSQFCSLCSDVVTCIPGWSMHCVNFPVVLKCHSVGTLCVDNAIRCMCLMNVCILIKVGVVLFQHLSAPSTSKNAVTHHY